jgi:hypothetical protein
MPTPPPEVDPNKQRPPVESPDPPGSPLRAVLTGLVIDLGGSTVASIVLGAFYMLQVSSSGMSDEQMKAALEQVPPQSIIAILMMVLGALCSVAGGYACARIVQRDEFRIGGVMAAISGMLSLMATSGQGSDDMTLLLTACTVASNLLGVKYGRDYNLRMAQPAAPPADTRQP